ncbi:hypothetical protein OIHEL45_20841 [Sulfitobacter indolifex HEL-45]|uniref:Uncharacterized protein n=1 Tax=Sulfitobacter indolifex HEL-45 TaxID=391624 RepID=A0ABM9X052_9RHOB|nr:hypothetical protein OIHEL45_20841 [Sulfitobacter indolifex HEL-45]
MVCAGAAFRALIPARGVADMAGLLDVLCGFAAMLYVP